jgi:hypothetical protein
MADVPCETDVVVFLGYIHIHTLSKNYKKLRQTALRSIMTLQYTNGRMVVAMLGAKEHGGKRVQPSPPSGVSPFSDSRTL